MNYKVCLSLIELANTHKFLMISVFKIQENHPASKNLKGCSVCLVVRGFRLLAGGLDGFRVAWCVGCFLQLIGRCLYVEC